MYMYIYIYIPKNASSKSIISRDFIDCLSYSPHANCIDVFKPCFLNDGHDDQYDGFVYDILVKRKQLNKQT